MDREQEYLDVIDRGLPRTTGPRKRVLVVGAGMAGLVAASALLRAGHEPLVIEAQQRVGGRVYTLREPFAPGLYAEAGAMRIPRSHRLTLAYVPNSACRPSTSRCTTRRGTATSSGASIACARWRRSRTSSARTSRSTSAA